MRHMFMIQKANFLSFIPFLVTTPIWPWLKKMMIVTNQPIVVSIVSLILSGCTGSTYSTHFDCPMGEGAGCASISKVNKMIDRQEIDLGNDDASVTKGGCISKLPGNQVYVYYGPDKLGRLISIEQPTPQEGN